MANKTLHTNQITFMDLTDDRKLDVYIASNLPTTQIKNTNDNDNPYTPDWSKTNLVLTADVYLDSVDVASNKDTSIIWYEQIGNSAKTRVGTSTSITISTNKMIGNPMVTYSCEASYQNITAYSQITFTRVDSGINGTDGKDGTSVTILGSYDTLAALQSAHPAGNAGDAYLVGGRLYIWAVTNEQWKDVGNIQGPKGDPGESAKGIILNGSSQVFKVGTTNITPEQITITAYPINTSITTWSYSSDGGKNWSDFIPTGVVLNTSTNTITITGSKLTTDSVVIKASDGTYSDTYTVYKAFDGLKGATGQPAPIVFLTNENISFGANANGQMASTSFTTNVVAYSGTTKVTPTIKTNVDGTLAISGLPTGMTVGAPITEENEKKLTFTIAKDSTLGSASNNNGTITIPITSPVSTNLILSWSKINAGPEGKEGVGISSISVKYGTTDSSSVRPDVEEWFDELSDVNVPEGHYLWTRTLINYTDQNKDDTVTYTYAKQGEKGDTGSSVEVALIEYAQGDSATTPPNSGWSKWIPVVAAEGKYLWTKTTFSTSDGLEDKFAYSVAKQGQKGDKGDTGKGISKVTESYLASTASSGVTTSTSGWTTTIQTIDASKRYLWNYETITYTDNTTSTTTPVVIGVFGSAGATGATGRGIKSIKEYYLASASSGGVTTSTTGWKDTMQSITATNKYLWNYEVITYTDDSTETLTPVIIGVYGNKGDKGDTGSAGRGVSSIVEQYYHSTSATSQTEGSWVTTAPTWADGKYIWTRSIITYTDNTTYTTSPICVTGQKGSTGGTGTTGVGVSSVDIWYYQSTSATALSDGSWSTSAPTWSDGKYVWTKTITTYTNNTTDETSAVCLTGQKGSTGVGVKSVTEHYLATSSSSGVTASTTGWTETIQTITSTNKYLWNYETITYTNNTTTTTAPVIIGVFGNTGNAGKGIKSVTEYYLATAASSGVTTSTAGWKDTMQTLTATNKYLWNYELITYTDNSTATINPVIIGVYGDKGDKGSQGDRGAGISSVTVTYGTSTSASTQPTSWQTTLPTVAEGSYLWTRTVTDYTDASIADTVTLTYAKQGAKGSTGSAGTSVTVSSIQYQAGTSATTAPTGTWSNSVVTVAEGSYLWTKTTFSDGKVAYGVAKQGAKGSAGVNAVTFQIYAPNGYLLSNELESLTLQTFAYDGSTEITSATYAWSYQENDVWVGVSNATTSSLTLTKDDVIKSKTYRCAMTYKGATYYSTATVQDQSDIYDVMICVSDNVNPLTGIYYWVVYALLYSEQGEADALLGPISVNAPTSPVSGDYWYAVDAATQTVTLKKYNGSTWVVSTDKQAYAYDWRQIIDGTQQQAIGNTDKVQIISCNSFTSSATFQCIVTDTDGSKLARCNIHLTDTSDPIVSATAPVGVKDGQLWMQTQTDGTFLLCIWDADTSTWKQLNADTKNVVHTTKPSSYKVGDLWVVESDTVISGYTKGTLLQSSATSTTFAAAHWTPSLKYEKELSEVQNSLKAYKQYMSVDSDGLHMQAKNSDGTLSPFQALFTNTRLSFLQDDLEVAYISDNKLNIYEASIDVLSVEKKIQLQKFEWAIESNGSMSLIVNY